MSRRDSWFWKGVLNSAEHGATRILDAANTLLLVTFLPSERFGELVVVQAFVAPLLLFFLTPETVVYREWREWSGRGREFLKPRLDAYRLFGRAKALVAIGMAALLATWTGHSFSAFVWSFLLVLTPQFVGADREVLRLALRLRDLNLLTLLQKGALLSATVVSLWFFEGKIEILALLTAFASLLFALASEWKVRCWLADVASAPVADDVSRFHVLTHSLKSFSAWNHIAFMLSNWVQTMDVFILGTLGPASGSWVREVGLYSAVVKVSNFAQALPQALSNLALVWMNQPESGDDGRVKETLRRQSMRLFAFGLVQAFVLSALAGPILSMLSRGRWSPREMETMVSWMRFMLAGGVLLILGSIPYHWATVRLCIAELALRVNLLWASSALLIYYAAFRTGGIHRVAQANVVVGALFLGLVSSFLASNAKVGLGPHSEALSD